MATVKKEHLPEYLSSRLYLGAFTVTGTIRVTDPCYSADTWCTKTVDISKGDYDASVYKIMYSDWGARIKNLMIVKRGLSPDQLIWRVIGEAGVDSGQCGFYLESKHALMKKRYSAICDATYSADTGYLGYIDSFGVFSSSGFGDGSYPILAGIDHREGADVIKGLMLEFVDSIGSDAEEEAEDGHT